MKLIYSQDVINLIEKSPINGWVKDALIEDVNALSSVSSKIVWCQDCKWWSGCGYRECKEHESSNYIECGLEELKSEKEKTEFCINILNTIPPI